MSNETIQHRNATGSYQLFELPHWVDYMTPAYKLLRKATTKKYGLITLTSSILLTLLLGLFNYWYQRFYYVFSKKLKLLYHSHSLSYHLLINSRVSRIIAFWTIYTLAILFPEAHQDLMFITKRLGRIAITLMPTIFFLTLRPSPLPKTLYLTLVPIHKWLSRIVVLQSLLHTIFYVAYYFHNSTAYKIYDVKQIYGWIPMLAFTVITITSIHPVRRQSFVTFYVNHYILSWVVVIFLYFHSRPPAKTATFLNVAILLFQMYLRFTNTSIVKLQIHDLSPNLKIIEIPKGCIPDGPFDFKHSIMPASHLRIQKYYKNPAKNCFYKFIVPLAHPYTIGSLPSDKSIVLVVRNTKFDLNEQDKYYITGSYDPDFIFISFESNRLFQFSHPPATKDIFKAILKPNKSYEQRQALIKYNNIITLSSHYKISASRVLMIIGGSGISVALPLLRILNIQGIPSKIIWVIKDVQDLKLFRFFKNIDINSIEIFLTSKTYKFEHLRENILRLDSLFGNLEEVRESSAQQKRKNNDGSNLNYYGNSSSLDEIDFTNFGTVIEPARHDEAAVIDALDENRSYTTVPLVKNKKRSKSLSSVGTPPSICSAHNKRLWSQRSFLDKLNLDTYLRGELDDHDDDDIEGSNADNVGINLSKNFTNYDNKSSDKRINKSRPVLADLFNTLRSGFNSASYGSMEQGNLNAPNPGAHAQTRTYSRTSRDNEEFRVPILVKSNAKDDGKYSGMVKQLKIFRGRPTLGQDEFNWCLNHVCENTISELNGEDDMELDFNTINTIGGEHEQLLANNMMKGGNNLLTASSAEEARHKHHRTVECCNEMQSADINEIIKKVWVVGVGPPGLTKKAKLWARENRLNFHEESFSV